MTTKLCCSQSEPPDNFLLSALGQQAQCSTKFTINAFVIVFAVGVGKAVTVGFKRLKLLSRVYGSVIGIFWAVGLTMFLLPPVPGVPVLPVRF